MRVFIIALPWPDAALSPNSRSPWAKINAAKAARADAKTLMGDNGVRVTLPDGPLVCSYKFYPPTRRWYDDDNLIASMKPWRDGIFDYFGTNDHSIVETSGRRCEVVKGGRVVVEISEDREDE